MSMSMRGGLTDLVLVHESHHSPVHVHVGPAERPEAFGDIRPGPLSIF